jgi:nitrate reductase (cytochrome)
MSLSRRKFLGHAAVAGSALAWAGCATREGADLFSGEMSWGKAPCRYCGTGCGTLVGVQDGEVKAVTGDPACPVNQGKLCVKGYHLPGMLYGADRLTEPMVRKGSDYQSISWDAALDLVAEKYQTALDQHGPSSLAMYGSGQWTIQEGYAALKWFKGGLRSNNIDPNARLCMASAVVGLVSTFGADEPMGCYDDFEKADVFVLWGNNMAEMHPVLFSRVLDRRRSAGHVRIVDITTRHTRTSARSDTVMMMDPQGDLAIANGILRWLIANDRVDQDFIRDHCVFKTGKTNPGYGTEDHFKFKEEARSLTFDEFKELVEPYTPERVEELAGIPAKQLVELAEVFGTPHLKVVSTWCMGMNQHVRGSWINQLVYAIHLLTGKIGIPGSNPFSLTGQPSACGTVREVGTLAHALPGGRVVMNEAHRKETEEIWGVPAGTIDPKPGTHAMAMFRALDRGEIKVMWVQVTNPFMTLPNLNRYRNGKRDRPDDSFLIVSDIYPTPTTALADLVLPSAGWVEKEGCFGNTERRTQQWDKLAEPPGQAKPDVWQTVEVAKRMGMGDLFPWEDQLEKNLYEEYRQFTIGVGKDVAEYEALRQVAGLRWPVVDGKETPYRYVAPWDPYADPDKRIDFYSAKKTGGKAVIWARPWEPAAEEPDDEYPFWLCTGRVIEHWHTGSMTRRVPQLHKAMPRAYVELHPDDATALGVTAGSRVKLITRRGELVLPAEINARAVPKRGNVFVPFFDESVPINELTLDAFCHMSKEPDYKKCAVKVEVA